MEVILLSKKSRERRKKHLARAQAQKQDQKPPPATEQNRKIIYPLTRVRKCEVPDDGLKHPLERFEPVPLEEVFGQNPPASQRPSPVEPSKPGKIHDFSHLVKDSSTVDAGKLLKQCCTDMCNAMTPRTADGELLNNMAIGDVRQAKIPVVDQPAIPTRENPIRPLVHAQEFANGNTPDGLHYADGYVECREGPDGKPMHVTTFSDPVRNLSPQDQAALELGRRMQQSGRTAQQPFPKQEKAPFSEESTAMEQTQEIGTVVDSPAKGCLIVTTNKGSCRLTNFRIIPLESRLILGKLEQEEPSLEYTFEIRCGVMRQTITVGATELDSIVKVIQSKMPICTATPTVLKASALISNYVREQILDLPQRIHVQRTGFMQFNGVWVYVHDGAIPPDPSIVFNTGRFIPDDRRVASVQAFHNAMDFLDICGKDELIIPLWLLAHLGPLFQLFHQAGRTPRFVTVLTGRSGSLKTSLSLILYRLFQNQGQTPTASFRDTETAMEIKLGELNGSVGIFDDFAPPAADQFRGKATREKLETIIRYVGDHVAKSRSNTKLGKAKEFIPSGVALVTAEDISGSQSSLLRCLVLSISKGDIDGAKLRHFQNCPDLIPTHMARFVAWVGEHGDEIVDAIRHHYPSHLYEGVFTELRLVDTATILAICTIILSEYARSIGAMTNAQADAFTSRCIQAVGNAGLASEAMTKEANPVVMYLNALFSLMERNEVRLADCNKTYNAEIHDGYLAGDCAWLDADIIFAKVTKYYSRLNIVFPLGERQLATHLADSGIINASVVPRENGGTKRKFRHKSSTPSRKPMQILHLNLAEAYLEENGNN